MTAPLRLLMRLQTRAAIRRVVRSAKRPKGAIFVGVGLLVFFLWLGPVLFSAAVMPRSDQHKVRLVAPIALLLMSVVTLLGGASDRAISFTPGEVNFLFPGPFSRRDLLFYKLARTFAGGVFSGVVLSLVFMMHASGWVTALVASVLAMLLVQLLAVVVLMAAQVIGRRAYSAGRRILLGLVVVAALIALVPSVRDVMQRGGAGAWQAVEAVNRTPVARVALAPFVPFSRAFTAQSPAELLLWGSIAAAIDLALFALVFRLDADYREAAITASQRLFNRAERIRRGQLIDVVGTRRLSPPMLPWLAGAGPTVWRQLTVALRTSAALLWVLLLLSVAAVPLLLSARREVAPAFVAMGMITMILSMLLKLDFRSELEQMEWLKALPLGPTATAAGQLAVPVLILSTVQAILLGAGAVLVPVDRRAYLLAGFPFILPFNLLMLGIDNLLFLLYPTRIIGVAPGDVGQMGRGIVFFLFKTFVLAFACVIAGVLGVIAALLAGESLLVGVIVASVTLAAMSIALVPCVGIAYRRFDPSSDTPA